MKINWRKFIVGLPPDQPTMFYLFGSDFVRPGEFKAPIDWRQRSREMFFGNICVAIASETDVLVNYIVNSEESRLLAYLAEIEVEPAECDLKTMLQNVVDAFRPDFEEEDRVCNPMSNTSLVWRCLYGKSIDIQQEIIWPAIEARREASGDRRGDVRH